MASRHGGGAGACWGRARRVARCALTSATAAWAGQSTTLTASFHPERLGGATSVSFAFAIKSPDGAVPSPLDGVEIRYPAGLGLATSGLGVATCEPTRLEASGPAACPADSRMGAGGAELRFQVGPQALQESASLALIAGPSPDGYLRLLIAATGTQPVAARVVMSTLLDEGALQITVPAVPSLPEGPDVAIVAVHATLGGSLIYYERRTRAHRRLPAARDRSARALPARRLSVQRPLLLRGRRSGKRSHYGALPRPRAEGPQRLGRPPGAHHREGREDQRRELAARAAARLRRANRSRASGAEM